MSSQKVQNRPVARRKKPKNLWQMLREKYINWNYIKYLAFNPAALPIVAQLILLAEALINVLVIQRVPYTEIDWVAYMQVSERESAASSIHFVVIILFSGMRRLSEWHHKLYATAR